MDVKIFKVCFKSAEGVANGRQLIEFVISDTDCIVCSNLFHSKLMSHCPMDWRVGWKIG